MITEGKNDLDRDWLAVAAAISGLIFSVGTLTIYSFGVFVRPLHAAFGWNRTELAGAVAISQIMLAFASPVWGGLIDRLGPRPVLLVSILLMSVLFASLSLMTPKLGHLYLIYAALPLLSAAASPLGYASVLIRRFERHLGLALGLATMGVGLGATIIPLLANKFVTIYGWRDAYFLIGLISLLVGVPAALVATRNTLGPVLRAAGAVALPLRPMIMTRIFMLLCTVFFLLGLTTVGVLTLLVPMMVDRGFPPGAAANLAALTGFSALVGRGVIGWVLDRVQASSVVAAIALLAAVSFLILVLDHSRASSYVAVIMLGSAIGAEVNFIAYMTRRYFVPAAFGRLYGIEFGIYLIGGGIGPLLLGSSFDHLGGYSPALIAFSLLTVAAGVIALIIPRSGYGMQGLRSA